MLARGLHTIGLGRSSGVLAGAALSDELLEELTVTTSFTKGEIRRLHRRFVSLDAAGTGVISLASMFTLPELEFNQFKPRLKAMWQEDLKDSELSFGRFVRLLAPLAASCPREMKMRFAFRLYDFDEDGMIGVDDLRATIHMLILRELVPTGTFDTVDVRRPSRPLVRTSSARPSRIMSRRGSGGDAARMLPSEMVDKVVDQVLMETDFDDDRAISFDEWQKVVSNSDIESKLTLHP